MALGLGNGSCAYNIVAEGKHFKIRYLKVFLRQSLTFSPHPTPQPLVVQAHGHLSSLAVDGDCMAERRKVKGESPGALVHKLFPSFVSLPPTPMLNQALNWRVGSYPATVSFGPQVVPLCTTENCPLTSLRSKVGVDQQVLGTDRGTLEKGQRAGGGHPREDHLAPENLGGCPLRCSLWVGGAGRSCSG